MIGNLERVQPETVGLSSGLLLQWLDVLEATGTEMHSFMIARYSKTYAEGW